jgi:DNA-binding GntR family transcriptional regulator
MTNQNTKTKKDQVVDIIREAVLSGELAPGEKLQQDKLAERLNVSSTPVREALRQLEAEGILNHIPRKGVRVVEVNQTNLRDVREIYLIRAVLESLATRLAVSYLNSAHVQILKALQTQMENEIEHDQLTKLRKPNYEFHMLIYTAADTPQLFQMIRNLWTKFPWDTLHVLPGRAFSTAEEHRRLVEAIEDGNAKLAGQLMQEHIENAAAALTGYLQSSNRL